MKQTIIKQNVGVDVSKDDIKVAISNLTVDHRVVVRCTRTFVNTARGFQQLHDWVNLKKDLEMAVHFTMEATGVYYEGLAFFLYEQEYLLHIVLPNYAKKYADSLGIKSKTDKLDAKALAQMGLERDLRLWQPVSPSLLGLKQLTREREALVCSRTEVANQLHAYRHQGKPNKESIQRSQEHIAFIDRQVKEIEQEITHLINQDEKLKTKIGYLDSIPGVSLVTAAVIVAETNGFAAFESIKQLTSYAGLDVRIQESGKWKGKSRISKRGNSHIRKALYMPSIVKKKHDSTTNRFFERIKGKKGVGMIAIVAVERKLLGLMFSLWKKEEMYSAQYEK
jgi:transposase